MIKVFYDKECSSCKNTLAWLEWHHLNYEKADIKKDEIKTSELIKILSLTENGTSDLISSRGKAFRNLTRDIEQLKLNEFIQIVEVNRQLLSHPILFDHSRVQIGSSLEEMRCFIPKHQRRAQLKRFKRIPPNDKKGATMKKDNLFSKRLNQAIERSQKSANCIERELGYPRNAFHNYKRGVEPSGNRLIELAQYFQLPPEYLMGKSNDSSLMNPKLIFHRLDEAQKKEILMIALEWEKIINLHSKKQVISPNHFLEK